MLTEDEAETLANAAKNVGAASVSDWVREVLIDAARKTR